jgi:predicted DNA-binding protein with PD1-like motif
MNILPVRLQPNQDLKQRLKAIALTHQIQAGFILTTVGSLQQATLRFAGQSDSQCFRQQFEIISLVGTLSVAGIHLHIGLADTEGKVIGGHVQTGCLIYTTAEIVIGMSSQYQFNRAQDEATGYLELEINQLK